MIVCPLLGKLCLRYFLLIVEKGRWNLILYIGWFAAVVTPLLSNLYYFFVLLAFFLSSYSSSISLSIGCNLISFILSISAKVFIAEDLYFRSVDA